MINAKAESHLGSASERRRFRAGEYDGVTSGLAPGHVQGNVVILPADWAGEFLRFCQANPKPCPLLACSDPGDAMLPTLGEDVDIRTDLPRYRVFRDGACVAEPTDIRELWADDLVTFVLGCSFSFEAALLADGLALRHIQENRNVAMYRTAIDCASAGRFRGKLVVSMRPLAPADAIRAIQITSRFPAAHGAPVHIGHPEMIGIADLERPDFGDPAGLRGGELPVFWACGVTPQVVLEQARPPIAITHKPGAMLITDLLSSRLAIL